MSNVDTRFSFQSIPHNLFSNYAYNSDNTSWYFVKNVTVFTVIYFYINTAIFAGMNGLLFLDGYILISENMVSLYILLLMW